jgi:hypothetical protein
VNTVLYCMVQYSKVPVVYLRVLVLQTVLLYYPFIIYQQTKNSCTATIVDLTATYDSVCERLAGKTD